MDLRRFFVAGLLIFFLSIPARAEDYPTYAGKKLGRGLSNTALGWTELFKSQEKIGDDHGIIAGIFWGTLDGIGNTVKRTAVGIYETATFPVKTSENADPILTPEFPANNDRAGYRPKDYSF